MVAWVEIMDDLSGLDAETLMWTDLKNCSDSLKAILAEFGKMYAPLLLENAKAVEEGLPEWSVDIDGSSLIHQYLLTTLAILLQPPWHSQAKEEHTFCQILQVLLSMNLSSF